ncbi:hypothetical protein [Pseudomonas aeruginosa]|uniref:hypothetical protein n=1 Tax=Pseudomonas aeruginosa TaxID=287 RepID=UPI001ABD297C|nr:hypothetical protein [Pseudomonas aeruginosa]
MNVQGRMIRVDGPAPRLEGEIEVPGAKNVAMPLLVAAALQGRALRVDNVPRIADVGHLLELLRVCAVDSEIRRSSVTLREHQPLPALVCFPADTAARLRGAVYALALPASQGRRAVLPCIGGDFIASRSFAPHCRALRGFGLEVRHSDGALEITGGRPRPAEFDLDDQGITATCLAILIAGALEGRTVLSTASLETECDDVIAALNALGARASREGRTILVDGPYGGGVDSLSVPGDHLVWGTLAMAAAITGGSTRSRTPADHRYTPVIELLEAYGLSVDRRDDGLRVSGAPRRGVEVRTGMFPSFPSDLLPPAMALAAVAPGTSVFHEAHYGSRFDHAGGMRALGARISIDGEHGTVKGGERLRGARLAGAGIRETTALLLLSLAAEGRTWLSDIGSLYRGYEDLPGALRHLGAPLHVLD